MSLTLHLHPLSSFCWKALIAFYEADVAFEPCIIDFGDPTSREAFLRLSPLGQMPVLRDEARDLTLPESSIVIEHLAITYPAARSLVPTEPAAALRCRLWDRVFDLHIHQHMQKIVGDRIRPPGAVDPFGVEHARARLRTGYRFVDDQLGAGPWAMGETFTLADCAAAPALYYGARVEPFGESFPRTSAYLERLLARPSVARAIAEAQPYFHMYPET